MIVFVDESGISERPTRVRTWGLKGQTPITQFHFNWNHVSVIAGLTRTNCLFRLHEGSIKKEEIVEFLRALKTHLKQPLLVIWDGLRAHRSRLVRLWTVSAGISRLRFCRRTRPISIRWSTCGPGSSGMLWPTTARTIWPSCTLPHETSSRAPRSALRSLPLAGCKLRFGNVMNYGSLNNT